MSRAASTTRRLLLLLLAGCGGIVDTPKPSEPEPSEQPGAPESLPPTGEGFIAITQGDASTSIFPAFRDSIVPIDEKTTLRSGECRIVADQEIDTTANIIHPNASAGTFRAHAGERSVELQFDEGIKSYYGGTFSGVGTLSPGASLEIEATGADVPPFQTTVQLTQPLRVLTSTEAGIAKDEAFTLKWEPSSEDVGVDISIAGEARVLRCFVDARLGAFAIAADYVKSVMDHPLQGEAVTLDVLVAKTTVLRAGTYKVRVLENRLGLHAKLAIR